MSPRDTVRGPARDTDPPGDEDTIRVLTSRLDAELDAIGPDIAARLALARRAATRSQVRPQARSWIPSPARHGHSRSARARHRSSLRTLGPAAFASGCAVALGVSLWLGSVERPSSVTSIAGTLLHSPDAPTTLAGATPTPLEHLNVLSASEDIDFYRSVDFLLWLESQRG